jgi:hypothetical protein
MNELVCRMLTGHWSRRKFASEEGWVGSESMPMAEPNVRVCVVLVVLTAVTVPLKFGAAVSTMSPTLTGFAPAGSAMVIVVLVAFVAPLVLRAPSRVLNFTPGAGSHTSFVVLILSERGPTGASIAVKSVPSALHKIGCSIASYSLAEITSAAVRPD